MLRCLAAILELIPGDERNMREGREFMIMQVPDLLQSCSSVPLPSVRLSACGSERPSRAVPSAVLLWRGRASAPSAGRAIQHGQDFFPPWYHAGALSVPLYFAHHSMLAVPNVTQKRSRY